MHKVFVVMTYESLQKRNSLQIAFVMGCPKSNRVTGEHLFAISPVGEYGYSGLTYSNL